VTDRDQTGEETSITLVRRGDVDDEAVAYALKRMHNVAQHIHEPILFGRVTLSHPSDPGRVRPWTAQATFDVNGDVVRAEAHATTMTEAIDQTADPLREQLRHRHQRRLARRREPA